MATDTNAPLTLYHCPQSRSMPAVWMLEEIGVPYEVTVVDVRTGEGQKPEYLAINPMGKVPALRHGASVITESGAVCLYLADRFAPGRLAPRIEAAARGAFLRWLFFAPIVDSALVEKMLERTPPERAMVGWGDYASVVRTLRAALTPGPWLLGETFSAADVVLGGQIIWGTMMKLLPEGEPFKSYAARAMERDACRKAWGQEVA